MTPPLNTMAVSSASEHPQECCPLKKRTKVQRRSVRKFLGFGSGKTFGRRRGSDDTLDMDESISYYTTTEGQDLSCWDHSCLKIRTQKESLDQITPDKDTISDEVSSSPADKETKVTFGSLAIRTYSVKLGDNPGVSSGPPLSIGDSVLQETTIDVENYEEHRPPRRQRLDLVIPSHVRFEWLREEGHSRAEIHQAMAAVRYIKSQRLVTVRGSPFAALFRACGSVAKKARTAIRPKGERKDEVVARQVTEPGS